MFLPSIMVLVLPTDRAGRKRAGHCCLWAEAADGSHPVQLVGPLAGEADSSRGGCCTES